MDGKKTYWIAAISAALVALDAILKVFAEEGATWDTLKTHGLLILALGLAAAFRSALKKLEAGVLLLCLVPLLAGCTYNSVSFDKDAIQNIGGGRRMPEEDGSIEVSTTADVGSAEPNANAGSGRDFVLILINQSAEATNTAELEAVLEKWFSANPDAP